MKFILGFCLCATAAFSAMAQTNQITVNVGGNFGLKYPNWPVSWTPLATQRTTGGLFVPKATYTGYTGTNFVATFTNVFAGDYLICLPSSKAPNAAFVSFRVSVLTNTIGNWDASNLPYTPAPVTTDIYTAEQINALLAGLVLTNGSGSTNNGPSITAWQSFTNGSAGWANYLLASDYAAGWGNFNTNILASFVSTTAGVAVVTTLQATAISPSPASGGRLNLNLGSGSLTGNSLSVGSGVVSGSLVAGSFTGDGSGLTGTFTGIHSGNGSGLTALSGGAIVGAIPPGALPPVAITNSAAMSPIRAAAWQVSQNPFPNLLGAEPQYAYTAKYPLTIAPDLLGNLIVNPDNDSIQGQTFAFSTFTPPPGTTNILLSAAIASLAGTHSLNFGVSSVTYQSLGYQSYSVGTTFQNITQNGSPADKNSLLIQCTDTSGTFIISNLSMVFQPTPTNVAMSNPFTRYEVLKNNIYPNFGPATISAGATTSWEYAHQPGSAALKFTTTSPVLTLEAFVGTANSRIFYIYTNSTYCQTASCPSTNSYQWIDVVGLPTNSVNEVEVVSGSSTAQQNDSIVAVLVPKQFTVRFYEYPISQKIYLNGDSILASVSETTNFLRTTRSAIERLTEYTVQNSTSGGAELWNDMARIGSRMSDIGASGPAIIWNELGFNDWYYNSYGGTNAFCLAYGQYLDAVHLAAPGAIIVAQTPIGSLLDGTTVGGYTLEQYRQSIRNAAFTRPWVNLVEGSTLFQTNNLNPDGIHPSPNGATQYGKRIALWIFNNSVQTNGPIFNYAGTFTGNGGGLTNVNGGAITGTVPLIALPVGVVTNNATGLTLTGTFTGIHSGNTDATTNGNRLSQFFGSGTSLTYIAQAGDILLVYGLDYNPVITNFNDGVSTFYGVTTNNTGGAYSFYYGYAYATNLSSGTRTITMQESGAGGSPTIFAIVVHGYSVLATNTMTTNAYTIPVVGSGSFLLTTSFQRYGAYGVPSQPCMDSFNQPKYVWNAQATSTYWSTLNAWPQTFAGTNYIRYAAPAGGYNEAIPQMTYLLK